jgi:chorismate mutase
MNIYGLRGAITVESNQREAILSATRELLEALLERNGLAQGDIVSCILSMTDDLNAEFPAVAAREMGLDQVPLLCVREIAVPGSMERVIRALVHYRAADHHDAQHVYLREAQSLRSDISGAQ